jgi:hypothetical protein
MVTNKGSDMPDIQHHPGSHEIIAPMKIERKEGRRGLWNPFYDAVAD